MSHQVAVMQEDKVTEEDQDMTDNVEQDVTNDEDSDQHCEEVSSALITFLIKLCIALNRM